MAQDLYIWAQTVRIGWLYLLVLPVVTVANLLRYAVTSGGLFLYFYGWRKSSQPKIQTQLPDRSLIRAEIAIALRAILFTTLFNSVVGVAILKGVTKVYIPVLEMGWWYLPFSFFLLLITHDLFHYWMHRLCHDIWWIYRRFHSIHHRFLNPTPFCDWSMHPLDALLNSIFPMIFIFVVPVHVYVFFGYLSFLLFMIATGHTGFEVFPRAVGRSSGLRLLGNVNMHNLHHTRVTRNFGLYTNVWDRVWGTFVSDLLQDSPNHEPKAHQVNEQVVETASELPEINGF